MDLMEDKKSTTLFLCSNIRFLRNQLRLSQEELGSRIGLNRGNIASYENGSAEPKICNLLKLSNLFGVTIVDLTQNDLSVADQLQVASQHYQEASSSEAELIQQFSERAAQLEGVIQSIRTCFDFKMQQLDESEKASKTCQTAHHKFDELFEASEELLADHQALIDFLACRLKK